jgi:CBS domain-containing protein
MTIESIMTSGVRCVPPTSSLSEAARLMRELDVGSVPVCDQDRLAGMLTDRDIVLRAVAEGRDPDRTHVKEVMSEGIIYIYADQAVEDAAELMEYKQIRRLPVLNREKRLVGIVSLGDVAIHVPNELSGEALKVVSQ